MNQPKLCYQAEARMFSMYNKWEHHCQERDTILFLTGVGTCHLKVIAEIKSEISYTQQINCFFHSFLKCSGVARNNI